MTLEQNNKKILNFRKNASIYQNSIKNLKTSCDELLINIQEFVKKDDAILNEDFENTIQEKVKELKNMIVGYNSLVDNTNVSSNLTKVIDQNKFYNTSKNINTFKAFCNRIFSLLHSIRNIFKNDNTFETIYNDIKEIQSYTQNPTSARQYVETDKLHTRLVEKIKLLNSLWNSKYEKHGEKFKILVHDLDQFRDKLVNAISTPMNQKQFDTIKNKIHEFANSLEPRFIMSQKVQECTKIGTHVATILHQRGNVPKRQKALLH